MTVSITQQKKIRQMKAGYPNKGGNFQRPKRRKADKSKGFGQYIAGES